MRNLSALFASSAVPLATAAAAFGLPPATLGLVPANWSVRDGVSGVVPELELEMWTDSGEVAVTAAELYGATPQTFTFATITITADSTTGGGTLTKTAHGLLTGDGPVNIASTLNLPAGLLPVTPYWTIKTGANTLQLASSLANALAGIVATFSDDGSGVITVLAIAGTQRIHWSTHDGLLGLAGDGAIALDAQTMYRKILPHSPRVIAYALVATLSTGTASAAVYPRTERA